MVKSAVGGKRNVNSERGLDVGDQAVVDSDVTTSASAVENNASDTTNQLGVSNGAKIPGPFNTDRLLGVTNTDIAHRRGTDVVNPKGRICVTVCVDRSRIIGPDAGHTVADGVIVSGREDGWAVTRSSADHRAAQLDVSV